MQACTNRWNESHIMQIIAKAHNNCLLKVFVVVVILTVVVFIVDNVLVLA